MKITHGKFPTSAKKLEYGKLHEIYLHQIPYRKYPTYILGMENSLQEDFLQ